MLATFLMNYFQNRERQNPKKNLSRHLLTLHRISIKLDFLYFKEDSKKVLKTFIRRKNKNTLSVSGISISRAKLNRLTNHSESWMSMKLFKKEEPKPHYVLSVSEKESIKRKTLDFFKRETKCERFDPTRPLHTGDVPCLLIKKRDTTLRGMFSLSKKKRVADLTSQKLIQPVLPYVFKFNSRVIPLKWGQGFKSIIHKLDNVPILNSQLTQNKKSVTDYFVNPTRDSIFIRSFLQMPWILSFYYLFSCGKKKAQSSGFFLKNKSLSISVMRLLNFILIRNLSFLLLLQQDTLRLKSKPSSSKGINLFFPTPLPLVAERAKKKYGKTKERKEDKEKKLSFSNELNLYNVGLTYLTHEKSNIDRFLLKKESYLIACFLNPNKNRSIFLQFVFINFNFRFIALFLLWIQSQFNFFYAKYYDYGSLHFYKYENSDIQDSSDIKDNSDIKEGFAIHESSDRKVITKPLISIYEIIKHKLNPIQPYYYLLQLSPSLDFQPLIFKTDDRSETSSDNPSKNAILCRSILSLWDGNGIVHSRVESSTLKDSKGLLNRDLVFQLQKNQLKKKRLKNPIPSPLIFSFMSPIPPFWNPLRLKTILFSMKTSLDRRLLSQNQKENFLLKKKNLPLLKKRILVTTFKAIKILNFFNFGKHVSKRTQNLMKSTPPWILLLQFYQLKTRLDKQFLRSNQKAYNQNSRNEIYRQYHLTIQFEFLETESLFFSQKEVIKLEKCSDKKMEQGCFFKSNVLCQMNRNSKSPGFVRTVPFYNVFFSLEFGLRSIPFKTNFNLSTFYFYKKRSIIQ